MTDKGKRIGANGVADGFSEWTVYSQEVKTIGSKSPMICYFAFVIPEDQKPVLLRLGKEYEASLAEIPPLPRGPEKPRRASPYRVLQEPDVVPGMTVLGTRWHDSVQDVRPVELDRFRTRRDRYYFNVTRTPIAGYRLLAVSIGLTRAERDGEVVKWFKSPASYVARASDGQVHRSCFAYKHEGGTSNDLAQAVETGTAIIQTNSDYEYTFVFPVPQEGTHFDLLYSGVEVRRTDPSAPIPDHASNASFFLQPR